MAADIIGITGRRIAKGRKLAPPPEPEVLIRVQQQLRRLAVLKGPEYLHAWEVVFDHILRTQTDPAFKAEMDRRWNEGGWFK